MSEINFLQDNGGKMNIITFDKHCVSDAEALAMENYREEMQQVRALPENISIPATDEFAESDLGLGVAAYDGSRMLGFLCCYNPWENAFDTIARGTFSPVHAHGAVKENRAEIYQRLYQAAAEKWLRCGITYHAICFYAHDNDAINAMFSYGFGMRCVDAIRSLEQTEKPSESDFTFRELQLDELSTLRPLRAKLSEHLSESPCFMYSTREEYEQWLNRAENRGSRIFAALSGDRIIAYAELADNGENFVTETEGMKNICGAYCLPEYRGCGVYKALIENISAQLKAEGIKRLGVDYESFNPTAAHFWRKQFTAYTKSLTRRIDEGALRKYC